MESNEETVESVYTVTITNKGPERAIARNELEAEVRSFIRKMGYGLDDFVVHVESH